jgi:predicted metal-dependent hydrolase
MPAPLKNRSPIASRAGVRSREVPYIGETLTLVAQPGRQRAHRRAGTLLVPTVDPVPAIERFYRRAARLEIGTRLDHATAIADVRYRDLSIRSQRTRWASCSSNGHMSFNWRLLLAPESVLDYVVWHEVCHLKFLDHSPRFWALVDRYWPGWREDRDWLRRHGASLVL